MYNNKLTFMENTIYIDITEDLDKLTTIQKDIEEIQKKYDMKNLNDTNNFIIDFLTNFLKDDYQKLLGDHKPTLLNNVIIFNNLLQIVNEQQKLFMENMTSLNNIQPIKPSKKKK